MDVSLLRLRKDILADISKEGGKFSLSRDLFHNDERRSVDADDRKWSDHKDRRSLSEGEPFEDQTAEKADDDDQSARCFFSARGDIIWYTNQTDVKKKERALMSQLKFRVYEEGPKKIKRKKRILKRKKKARRDVVTRIRIREQKRRGGGSGREVKR